MRQNRPPDATLFTNLDGLSRRSVHFASGILLHTNLERGFMDKDPSSLRVVPKRVARNGIT